MSAEPINAVGVFQGGGVKVSAHVGAFKACTEQNVNFVRLAGTSGGAIIASLIAAGYGPEELKKVLDEINFKDLFSDSKKLNHHNIRNKKIRGLFRFLTRFNKTARFVRKRFENFGIYDLSPLEEWLNKKILSKLHIHENRLIRFSDLSVPLIIIAADLVEGRHKIFSKERTPDESIAQAVRASASIPIVFQPLVENSEFLIDGGIVSNLPISIVERELFKKREKNVPIIAFSIKSQLKPGADFPWTQRFYLEKLIDIVSDGNVEIQKLNLPENSHLVTLLVNDVKSTDFTMSKDKKDELFHIGYNSTIDYFTNQEDFLHKKHLNAPKIFRGREDIFSLIQHLITTAKKDIVFILDELSEKITYNLVLTLTIARIRGLKIIFVIFPKVEKDLNRSSLKLLKQIGVIVIKKKVSDRIPFKGLIVDHETDYSKLVLIDSLEDESNDYCTIYTKIPDFQVFSTFGQLVKKILSEGINIDNEHIPKIVPVELKTVQTLYRNIYFYEANTVEIEQAVIDPSLTVPHTRFVREFKLNQIKYYRKFLKEKGFSFYQPLEIILLNGKSSIINPPVVELKEDGKYHVVEGHNRIYYSRLLKERSIDVIVIKNVKELMPSKSYKWSEVEILSNKADEEETNKDNIQDLLRRIEKYTHVRDHWND